VAAPAGVRALESGFFLPRHITHSQAVSIQKRLQPGQAAASYLNDVQNPTGSNLTVSYLRAGWRGSIRQQVDIMFAMVTIRESKLT
jgi:hypothetical protein